jgi:hypothetical protein
MLTEPDLFLKRPSQACEMDANIMIPFFAKAKRKLKYFANDELVIGWVTPLATILKYYLFRRRQIARHLCISGNSVRLRRVADVLR